MKHSLETAIIFFKETPLHQIKAQTLTSRSRNSLKRKYQSNRCSLQIRWATATLVCRSKASSLVRSSRGHQPGGTGSDNKGLRRKRLPTDERKSLCSPTGLAEQLRSHRHNSNHDKQEFDCESSTPLNRHIHTNYMPNYVLKQCGHYVLKHLCQS